MQNLDVQDYDISNGYAQDEHTDANNYHEISFYPASVTCTLSQVVCILIFLSILCQVLNEWIGFSLGTSIFYKLDAIFRLDSERNVPTFFSSFFLIAIGVLLAMIALFHWRAKQICVLEWVILSLGFLLMATDESYYFHEQFCVPIRRMLGDGKLGILYFSWVIIGMIVVGLVGIFFLRFLFYLPKKTRYSFLIAGFVYLSGAIGIELLEGYYYELYNGESLTYAILATSEESLEMIGEVLFIQALLIYIQENYKKIEISFQECKDV